MISSWPRCWAGWNLSRAGDWWGNRLYVNETAAARSRFKGLGVQTPGAASLVQSTAVRYGVDPDLALALAQQESGLDQSALSPKGARGVMQLMPATAADLGVNAGDLAGNIDGGIRYLAQMLRRFGDTALALAAYNAGPGAVQKYGGVPPYAETQSYVSSIMGKVRTFVPPGPTEPVAWGEDTVAAGEEPAGAQTSGSDLSWLFSLPASAPDTAWPAVVALGAVLGLWLAFRR